MTTGAPRRHAEIAGAGFAGLAAAIALCDRGWSVTVHEANDVLRELGAGIFVWDNGLSVLGALGVLDRVLESSCAPPVTEIRVDGATTSVQPANVDDAFAMRTMTRQALYAAMLEGARRAGAAFRTASRVVAATPEGELVLESGERRRADVAIGADGVGSAVRASLGIATERVTYDNGILRVLVDRGDEFAGEPWDRVVDFWCHRTTTRRVLYVPCDARTAYLALMTSVHDGAGSRVPIDAALWSDAFPALRPLLAQIGERGRHDRYQANRVERWSAGRAVLVGDAAHAMPPTLGQGAGIAMENALALAVALDEHQTVEAALRAWEARERAFTEHTQRRAEELAAMGPERSRLQKREVGQHAAAHVPTGTVNPAPASIDVPPEAHARSPWYRAAWALVLARHGADVDRLGRPSAEHFVRVANRLTAMFPQATPAQIQAALLHDAFEPGGCSAADLRTAGIAEAAIRMIEAITLPRDGRSYLRYSQDLAASGDLQAIQVKLADNADALDLFGGLGTAEGRARVEAQYLPARAAMLAGLPERLRRQMAAAPDPLAGRA